jgi:hypothetical protein
VVDLPTEVRGAIEGQLRRVDGALPGLVEGLHVVGSIALDDFHPAHSDIDLVAICDAPLSPDACATLTRLHQPSRPNLDVLYVTRDDLARDPSGESFPHSLDGAFHADGGFDANPVVWRTLGTKAIAVRGPGLAASEVWFDPAHLRAWNLANLDGYWTAKIEEWRCLSGTEALVRHQYGLQWLVLGVPRLHFTVATLEVTSKTGAGRYALDIVDERWRPVLEMALALRADQSAPLTAAPDQLWHDGLDLSAWLIGDAQRLSNSVS